MDSQNFDKIFVDNSISNSSTDGFVEFHHNTPSKIERPNLWEQFRESIDNNKPKTLDFFELGAFRLPIEVDADCDYVTTLFKSLDKYNSVIKAQDFLLPSSVIDNLYENITFIKNSLKHYYNAEVIEAQKCIYNLISKYLNNPFIVNEIDKNYAFRGIAPEYIPKGFGREFTESDHYKQMNSFPLSFFKARISDEALSRNQMLHIPFNKRELVATQRFSIPGVPCLYLGTTSLICWLEMGEPEYSKFYCSTFKIPGTLKILNLCLNHLLILGQCASLKTINNKEQKFKMTNNIYGLIELFPLVIATSFRVKDDNRKFKSEYVISQLLMQVIKSQKLDGIAYLSKKMFDYYAMWHGVNLALLANSEDIINDEMYFNLKNDIGLTTPVQFENWANISAFNIVDTYHSFCNHFFNKRNGLDRPDQNNLVILNNIPTEYIHTKFSQFDEFLLRQSISKI